MRRHTARISNFTAGLTAAVVIAAACYLVFGGSLPFSGSGFKLGAMFRSETSLRVDSAVRIAGVDVGRVTSVKRVDGSTAALVTMDINNSALPIHGDATLRIRPRIFLEGNFYLELSPGTPSAPTLSSGAILPAANTAGPVQLDRVLSDLRSDSRANLQTLLQGFGTALNGAPNPAQDASQDPSVRRLTAAQSLNASLKYSADAFRASTIVNEGLLGTERHDLSQVVSGNERVFKALADSQSALSSLVHTFNATMAALASRQQDLGATIAALPPLLRNTNSADSALDASFPPTRAFATRLAASIGQLDPTIGFALPWFAQATALSSRTELGGLLSSLTPAVQNTANTIGSTRTLLGNLDQLARCFIHNIIPTGNEVIADPPIGTGLRVYQELFQGVVGIAGAAGNFDGNGRYVRSSAGGGSIQVQTPSIPGNGPLYANAVLQPLGTRPAFRGKAPPVRRDIPCAANSAPNLNNVKTGAAP